MGRHNSKSAIFLMEMIVVIMFFSICGAICLNVFSGARVISEESQDINEAVRRATTVAETFRASKADMTSLTSLLEKNCGGDVTDITDTGSGVEITYNDDMKIVLWLESDSSINGAEVTAFSYANRYKVNREANTPGGKEIFSIKVAAGGEYDA